MAVGGVHRAHAAARRLGIVKTTCGEFVSWYNGEYEGYCELPDQHEGDHFDGMSWYDDDGESTDYEHHYEHPPRGE